MILRVPHRPTPNSKPPTMAVLPPRSRGCCLSGGALPDGGSHGPPPGPVGARSLGGSATAEESVAASLH